MQLLGKAKKPAVVVLSDLHVGSVVGLWPSRHAIEGGGKYEENVFQKWLLDCWHEAVKEIARLRPKPIIVLNGDSLQGASWRDGQLVTPNINIQQDAALTLLEPVQAAARTFYMIRGTEWHEGKASEHVEMLAKMLGAKQDPASGQNTWWELWLDLDGYIIHFAHHIGVSSVPWYESTCLLRDLLMFIAEVRRFGGPDVKAIVRSHRHRCMHVAPPPNLNGVITPGWQLRTAFSYKRSSAMLPQIGYIQIERAGKGVLVDQRLFELPGITAEVV